MTTINLDNINNIIVRKRSDNSSKSICVVQAEQLGLERIVWEKHAWNTLSTTATCTQSGLASQECSRCGRTRRIDAAPLGHSYNWYLTSKGYLDGTKKSTESQKCDRCGNVSQTRSIEPYIYLHTDDNDATELYLAPQNRNTSQYSGYATLKPNKYYSFQFPSNYGYNATYTTNTKMLIIYGSGDAPIMANYYRDLIITDSTGNKVVQATSMALKKSNVYYNQWSWEVNLGRVEVDDEYTISIWL